MSRVRDAEEGGFDSKRNLTGEDNMAVETRGDGDDSVCNSFASAMIFFVSVILIIVTFPFSLCVCIRMVQVTNSKDGLTLQKPKFLTLRFQEYERAVIFRLGRIKEGGAVGPGLFFIIPCMDQVMNWKRKCVEK